MLERKCRKIAKYCYMRCKNSQSIDVIKFEEIPNKVKISNQNIYICCSQLQEEGYISEYDCSDDYELGYLIPAYKIYNYREVRVSELFSFLRKSVLVPIIVAFLTALVTTLLKDYLIPLIISWLI